MDALALRELVAADWRALRDVRYEARLAWARARPHFARAVVGHRRSNTASRRLIERCGFRWTRTRLNHWADGTDEEHVGYELPLDDRS